ncbi:hypothetical protein H2203_003533 [Taxawa tesnikishii (nom. ined.)]|nr:hypothetical protein H2203_003533 [Dothideales sp. JES 119]
MADHPGNRSGGILSLSNELLRDVLDQIAADPDRLVNVDRRAYLSQESFRPPPPPSRDQAEDIGSFRLVCKRFAELGAPHQFGRVTTRFSVKGFERLEAIAEQPHLAKHVKKFSYMVPCFYSEGDASTYMPELHKHETNWRTDRERLNAVLPRLQLRMDYLDLSVFDRKANEQRKIVRTQEDHVQILRVQDRDDERLLNLVRHNHELAHLVQLQWAPACMHSAKTIGAALLASHSKTFSRFSSPMLSPVSAVTQAEHPPSSFSRLAERLTCLELHFDDGSDLESRMQELSSLFKTVFTAAINMEAVHVGFPSHRPLDLPLEALFHDVRWKRLVAFGVQGWRLNADEIIALARRHRDRLKGLRLRDVLLKEGSMWKDVLGFLRDSMLRLDWVSLRRIGYAKYFDEYWAHAGHEIPDDPPGGASESDDDSDMELYEPTDAGHEDSDVDRGTVSDFGGSEDITDSEHDDSDDEHGPRAHEMDFPPLHSPDTPSSVPWCNCNGNNYPNSVEDLGDDGIFVDNTKRKMWEKWVMRRCPEHDPPPS